MKASLLPCTTLLLCLLGAAACGPPPAVSLDRSTRNYTASDYDTLYRRWTRERELLYLQGADQRINVASTYFSWEFRHALIARLAQDATLATEERTRELERSLQTATREHEFFVALVTTQFRYGLLHRPSTAWRAVLVDDRGRQVSPDRIEYVRRPTARDAEYFPYVTPWRAVFRLHFPARALHGEEEFEVLGPGTRYFVLRFSGPLGTADLRWDVAPVQATPQQNG